MKKENPDELISMEEAGKIAYLHPATIRRAILRGDLPGYKLGSGLRSSLKVYKYDVINWIASCKIDPDTFND